MIAVGVALIAGLGVHLLYGAIVLGRGALRPPRQPGGPRARRRLDELLTQSGVIGVKVRHVVAAGVALFALATAMVFVIFGAVAPAVVVGCFAATYPVAAIRHRVRVRREVAQDAWPRLLEELRILTGSLGRSIPQALFDVGRRSPAVMTDAFAAAQREWVISTDFPRTMAVLKDRLADPTADVVCETLLVAHALGGNDLDRRLAALIDDRIQDVQGRKDARAKQAGARFSRRFVLVVPFGMAVAGMSVGNGRAAYASAGGQALTVAAVGVVVVCWIWSGRILRIPDADRVFRA